MTRYRTNINTGVASINNGVCARALPTCWLRWLRHNARGPEDRNDRDFALARALRARLAPNQMYGMTDQVHDVSDMLAVNFLANLGGAMIAASYPHRARAADPRFGLQPVRANQPGPTITQLCPPWWI